MLKKNDNVFLSTIPITNLANCKVIVGYSVLRNVVRFQTLNKKGGSQRLRCSLYPKMKRFYPDGSLFQDVKAPEGSLSGLTRVKVMCVRQNASPDLNSTEPIWEILH